FPTLGDAVDDWTARGAALGFVVKRANHAFVVKSSRRQPQSETGSSAASDETMQELRHRQLGHPVATVRGTLDDSLATHAVQLQATGRLRVALDIRHIPVEPVGTRIHAVSLARALAERPEIELTLLVRQPAHAEGMRGRVVTEDQWADDVAVIHKPGQ